MITGELRDYQREGVDFLKRTKRAYLAADPGLGKTVQVCVAVKEIHAKRGVIICPDTINVKIHWFNHLVNWAGVDPEDVYIVQSLSDKIPDKQWIIVGYAQIICIDIWLQVIARRHAVCVIDEAQNIKSHDSIRTLYILHKDFSVSKTAVYVWYLSGTPVPNRPIELFPILLANIPRALGKYRDFIQYGKRFCSGFLFDWGGWNFNGASNVDELQKILEDSGFMLVQSLERLGSVIPNVVETEHYFDVDMDCDEHDTLTPTLTRMIGLSKLPILMPWLKSKLQYGGKRIVVAYHKEVIETLVDELREFNPVFVNGSVSNKNKRVAIDWFIQNESCRVIIVQIKSGGVALDGFQDVCNHMTFIEPDWSDGTWKQMIGRLRRLGQKKTVFADICIAAGTLDEAVLGTKNAKTKVRKRLIIDTGVNNMSGLLERHVEALESIAESLKEVIRVTAVGPNDAAKEPAKDSKSAKDKKADKESKNGAEKVTVDDVRQIAAVLSNTLQEKSGASEDDATAVLKGIVSDIGKADALAKVAEKLLPAVKEAFEKAIEDASKTNVAASI